MEVDHSVQFVAFQNGPATAFSVIHLIIAVPGPFDGRLAISCRQTAIHVSADVTELEAATVFVIELNESRDFGVDKILVPLGHGDDVPKSGERRSWFYFRFCHWSNP